MTCIETIAAPIGDGMQSKKLRQGGAGRARTKHNLACPTTFQVRP